MKRLFFLILLFVLIRLVANKNDPLQSVTDALNVTLEEGINMGNAALVRNVISLLEAQGHDCTDVNARLTEMVRFVIFLFFFIFFFLCFITMGACNF